MGHSYISCYIQCVFSTKGRVKTITPEIEKKLWPYMYGIARERKIKVLVLGGTEDHIHILISLPATISLANAMQAIKGVSSKWVHESFPDSHHFNWQEGYSAFSVGIRNMDRTIAYINNQKTHHRSQTYQEELNAFFVAHGMDINR